MVNFGFMGLEMYFYKPLMKYRKDYEEKYLNHLNDQ